MKGELMKVKVYNREGQETGEEVDLLPEIFDIEPNDHVVYLALKQEMANARQWTRAVKGRSQIRGGGRKPWRQKGRGTARAGTIRSPLWRGGGRIHGPLPLIRFTALPKKVKVLARKSALTYKARDGRIRIVEDFALENPKTKEIAAVLNAFQLTGVPALLMVGKHDPTLLKSCRNISTLQMVRSRDASTYSIMRSKMLLIQKSALNPLYEVFGRGTKENHSETTPAD
jgi:large subunit ribosomal protein L4